MVDPTSMELGGYAEELLELLAWTLDGLLRPSLSKALAGPKVSGYMSQRRAIGGLRQRGLVERVGDGRAATFRITAQGRRVAAGQNPRAWWSRPWDGRWRVFSFDVPEIRRAERRILYGALRRHKLGLLQRSVWVWPREVEGILKEIIDAEGIPECFVGFEASRVLLCRHAEIVEAAWNFEAINRYQERYVREGEASLRLLSQAGRLPALFRQARVERLACEQAFRFDPWLPRELWPKGYRGSEVQDWHEKFRAVLATRFRELAGAS